MIKYNELQVAVEIATNFTCRVEVKEGYSNGLPLNTGESLADDASEL